MIALLQECGEGLYGPRWQSDLARDLGVSDRTMRRWVAGTDDAAPEVYQALLRLVQERGQTLSTLAAKLRRRTAP